MKNYVSKIGLVALSIVSVVATGAERKDSKKASPVNIVLFVADDLGSTDLGAYGNTVVRTPNLDHLASQSLVFTDAFASSPTCSPSRASIHTGLYPFRSGAHANHHGVRQTVKTLPAYLNELGYKVGFAGKLHIGPMDIYPFEMIHNTNVPEAGHEKDGVLWTDLDMGPVDQWLGDASKAEKPFMLVVNDHSPHVMWPEKPEYDYTSVDIPPIHIDTKDTRVSRARYYTDITKMDSNVGKLLESLEKYQLDKNTIIIFTADQGPQWAFGKWNLYDYGIKVPLIIRWPGVVQGGSDTHTLVSLVDIVPTAIEMAGGNAPKEPEQIDGRSLVPFLKGEKASHRDVVFGSHTGDGAINQAPMRMIRTSRYKYILNLAPSVLYNTHINLAKDHDGGRQYWPSWIEKSFFDQHAASVLWRYHNRPAEELYDVLRDPNELCNLASDPSCTKIMEQFRQQMTEWRTQQGDTETGVYTETGKGGGLQYIFK